MLWKIAQSYLSTNFILFFQMQFGECIKSEIVVVLLKIKGAQNFKGSESGLRNVHGRGLW